ncbi:MAG: hypothetical protein ACP5PS_00385, partial [Bacteroidales bacterium]
MKKADYSAASRFFWDRLLLLCKTTGLARVMVGIMLFLVPPKVVLSGDLWLPAFFTDHMVLQQQMEAPIWGKANPGSPITLTASWGSTVQTKADATGKWKVKIKTPKAGGPYSMTVATPQEEKILQDILIGEVWICSGQSNMEMPLGGWPPRDTIEGATREIAQANNPYLRTFTVTRAYSIIPVDSCIGQWVSLNPQTAAQYSATAYFFGKKLYETLKVPVGLIHTSWGGTPA